MKRVASILMTLVLIALIAVGISFIWNKYMYTPWTRDGRVRAEVVSIAPDVTGWIDTIDAKNAQSVKAGETLFTIDGARYQVALEQMQAAEASAKVDWLRAQDVYNRRSKLSDGGVSAEEIQLSRLDMDGKLADYKHAQANVAAAQIDVARTVYRAPSDGKIINLDLERGDYVQRGVNRLAIVKDHSYYVTGYFEETKIPSIRIGDPVEIWLMAGKEKLLGHIEAIDSGISNDNLTPGNEMLPTVSPNFTWIRLAQRIPVDIKIDTIPAGLDLSAGMSATLKVDVPADRADNERTVLSALKTDFASVLH